MSSSSFFILVALHLLLLFTIPSAFFLISLGFTLTILVTLYALHLKSVVAKLEAETKKRTQLRRQKRARLR